ncbi:hypothetical protein [Alteromonas sp. a30]|uniref:hypothetical protein n=1 Tax=Alteromonas sp. a30 TaxID=2730917 RepID=UPI002281FC26|nr:hypothetical protein [Alteromonas sp. a30]MCY7297215.1 hypothetical protein [Alteromonas sp. a30]
MKLTKLLSTVAIATLAFQSPNLLASDVGSTVNAKKSQEAPKSYTPEYFEQAGVKYVEILEQDHYRMGEFEIYNQQLADLAFQAIHALPEEREAIRLEFTKLQNEALSKTADYIGVSVIELPAFWDYFAENRSQFIKQGSPLFDENDIGISALERIKVVCNGNHCNDPTHFLVVNYVRFAFFGRVPATKKAEVRIVNDSNIEYKGSSGIWHHVGVGSVEYIGKTCERCNLN